MSQTHFFRRFAQVGILVGLLAVVIYMLAAAPRVANAATVNKDAVEFTEELIIRGLIAPANVSEARALAKEQAVFSNTKKQTHSQHVAQTAAIGDSKMFQNLFGRVSQFFEGFRERSEKAVGQQATLNESQIFSILSLLRSFQVEDGVVNNVESALRDRPVATSQATFSDDNSGDDSTDEQTPPVVTAQSQVAVYTCTNLPSTLARSRQNNSKDVTLLQRFLRQYPAVAYVSGETGFYGRETKTAVEQFQVAEGLVNRNNPGTELTTGYGVVGPQTRARIQQVTCGNSEDHVDVLDAPEANREPVNTRRLHGDINNDGRITATDALLVERFVAQLIPFTSEQERIADVNQSGRVTKRDAELILKRATGAITKLPIIENDPARDTSGEQESIGHVDVVPPPTTPDVDEDLPSTETNGDTDSETSDTQNDDVSEEIAERTLGDINNDGKITVSDALRYFQALASGPELNTNEREVADVNNDGRYDAYDAEGIFVKSISREFTDINDLNRIAGDMNLDNKITATDSLYLTKYLDQTHLLTPSQERAADVDQDDNITRADVDAILARAVGTLTKLPIAFGDTTGDGRITATDALRIAQIVAGTGNTPTEYEKFVSDVNRDGVITDADTELVLKAATGAVGLPLISAVNTETRSANLSDALDNIFTFLQTGLSLR